MGSRTDSSAEKMPKKRKTVPRKNVVVKNGKKNGKTDGLAEQYRIIGNRWWQELDEYVEFSRSAEEPVPLLLTGPTGSGKGLTPNERSGIS